MHKLFKIAALALQALISSYVLYLVGINALLVSGLAKTIANRTPEKIFIDYSSAYSLWPGSVHANDFLFRGQDSVLQWQFRFDEARTHFALFELPRKRVHLTSGWARGVSVRIRLKVEPANASLPSSSWLPPIPGYDDPPIKGPSVPDPPDSDYPYVTLHVEDAIGEDIREVWVDTIRSQDHGRVAGGFYFKPMRWVELAPSTVWLDDATVTEGSEILALGIRGRTEAELAGFDPRTIDPEKLLAKARVRTTTSGVFPSLRPANAHLPPFVALEGGGGRFAFTAGIEDGILERGTAGIVRSNDWHLFSGAHHVSGTTEVRGTVVDARWNLVSETTNIVLAREKTVTARAPTVTAIAHTTPAILQAIDDAALSVDLPAAEASDLHVLDAYIGDSIFERGAASLSAHADVEKKILRGKIHAAIRDATLSIRKRPFPSDATIDLAIAHADTRHADLTGSTVELRNPSTGWWARTTIGPGSIDDRDGVDLVLTAKARDAKPVWTILAVPGLVQDILGGRALAITGHFRAGAKGMALESVHAVGDEFEVEATYATSPGRGAALLHRGPYSAGVEIHGDDLSIVPLATRPWYRGAVARTR